MAYIFTIIFLFNAPLERVLAVSEGVQLHSLHATLKDLTSVLQALGRIAEHFSCDRFTERLPKAQQIVNQ